MKLVYKQTADLPDPLTPNYACCRLENPIAAILLGSSLRQRQLDSAFSTLYYGRFGGSFGISVTMEMFLILLIVWRLGGE